jgi:signal transduction histidine kinase
VTRLWQLVKAHGFDLLIAIVAVEAALEIALREGTEAPTVTPWFAVPAVALLVLTLLGRHRFPFAAPASVWVLAAALSFVDGRLIPFAPGVNAAGFAAAFLLGNLRDGAQARLGLAIVVGGSAIVIYNDPSAETGDLVFTPLLFAIGWLAGYALRARADEAEEAEARAAQAEREREAAARVAVAEERTRIARELHDVVAHAVSVMVLQVGAVRHRLAGSSPEDTEALAGVERTGRTALAEMRRLLGAMRSDGDEAALAPQSGLSRLGGLAEEVGHAGLPVRLHIHGEPYPLPHGLDVSAYRIIQEGLTNALRHAGASRAEVEVRYRSEELCLEVRDDGRGGAVDGGGYGLIGIRERVKIYGGEMSTDTGSDGGFVLRARLPVRGEGR